MLKGVIPIITISRDNVCLAMSPMNKPAAVCQPGDAVVFETLDCFSNEIQSNDKFFSSVGWDRINPATGPLFVEGARQGDVLRVEIMDIELDEKGVMTIEPGFGALGEFFSEEYTKIFPVKNKIVFNEKIKLKAKPMIGVIGTAPATGEVPNGTPGDHGGNMDCKKITAGSVVFLPVNVPGALLALGDLHALMGDGEVLVCGLEISGIVTVKVEVLRDRKLVTPMVCQKDKIMCIASAETIDEASSTATKNMFLFLTKEAGIDGKEAGMLLSLVGNLRICQIVDPLLTARMEFPLDILAQYGYSI